VAVTRLFAFFGVVRVPLKTNALHAANLSLVVVRVFDLKSCQLAVSSVVVLTT
jgi:hypothetical protein